MNDDAYHRYMELLGNPADPDDLTGRPHWEIALRRSTTEHRVTELRAMWDNLHASERPSALCLALHSNDHSDTDLQWLHIALAEMRERGTLVFDGEEARAQFDGLPAAFMVYRGTVQSEPPNYRRSWTIDRAIAERFATIYVKHRDPLSPALILSAHIHKTDASGFLCDYRGEAEILIAPDVWRHPRLVVEKESFKP